MVIRLDRSGTDIVKMSAGNPYWVWRGIFMLDMVLCVMTGRPPSTGEAYCTAPLRETCEEEDKRDRPAVQLITDQRFQNIFASSVAIDGSAVSAREYTMSHANLAQHGSSKRKSNEYSTQSVRRIPIHDMSYSLYMVDLALLIRKAVNTLYFPEATRRPFFEIETMISTFNSKADNWFLHLPAEFRMMEVEESRPFVRERAGLAFRFYSAKIIILWPCLRRFTQSPSPGSICKNMAILCVQVAGQMIDLLPDGIDVAWLYRATPWWCVLHYIMQSISVLLIALLNQSQLGTSTTVSICEKVEKAIRWLGEMSTKDPSSRRAWLLCKDLYSRFDFRLDAGC